MALGGGNFTAQNKVLPGAYINYVSVKNAVRIGNRGVATLPVELDWGGDGEVFAVSADNFSVDSEIVFGCESTDTSLLLVNEALKRADTLLLYRVNGNGVKACAEVGGLAVTARYSGLGGNKIKIEVRQNIDDSELFDVITYLGTAVMDEQTVMSANELVANDFVIFGECENISLSAATPLENGSNGTVTGQSYADYLVKIEGESFNAIGYPGDDAAVKSLFVEFVKRLRNKDGKKITGVLYDCAANCEGIINVKNGVVLADGTEIPGEKAVAWVAGATAAAQINSSLTNVLYDGAAAADRKMSISAMENAILDGEFVFYTDGNSARVLSDVNSLANGGDWCSNRVVRVMDSWANDIAEIFSTNYLGKVTNSGSGRNLFKADIISLGKQYLAAGAISDFDSDDIVIEQGEGRRDVVVTTSLVPNDSMEKLYMTVTVV